MASGLGRTERTLKIIQWLSASDSLTTSDIYNRFKGKVSIRNIQRDLVKIEQAGLPLVKQRNAERGYAWELDKARTWMLPTLLGVGEYMAALLLKESLQVFEGTSFQEEINALINNLIQIAPEEYFDDKDLSVLDSLPFGEVDYGSFSDEIHNVITAIRNRKICLVYYKSRTSPQPKQHNIVPLRLIYHRGGLYLAGYRADIDKTLFLAIDRMQRVELTDQSPTHIPAFSLSDIKHRRFGLMPNKRYELVELEFDDYSAPLIRHRKWHQKQHIEELDNGSLILSMRLELSPDFESWIMRWMPHVRIKSPETLRRSVRKKMKEGLAML